MNDCAKWPCSMNKNTGLCHDVYCPMRVGQIPAIAPSPSPRFMPVNIPFSLFGITIVTLDGYGNVSIKVDQPYPPSPQETAP